MSFYVHTDTEFCTKVAERGSGAIARFVCFLNSGTTETGMRWLQFKIAVKKYAETKSDKCKYEYYVMKAWSDNVDLCKKQLKKGCIIKFFGEQSKGYVTTPEEVQKKQSEIAKYEQLRDAAFKKGLIEVGNAYIECVNLAKRLPDGHDICEIK